MSYEDCNEGKTETLNIRCFCLMLNSCWTWNKKYTSHTDARHRHSEVPTCGWGVQGFPQLIQPVPLLRVGQRPNLLQHEIA